MCSKSDFLKMEVLGQVSCKEWLVQSAILSLLLQFNLGFILTKLGSDLFIIDQVSQLLYFNCDHG